jgi:two-component system alkaline phosphatase synthesis response regulator PhoP/two-component system response regulator ResD
MDTLLIVDDERNIVELIELYAKQAGFNTLRANDGETALHMIERESPALVILDLMLPKVSGWDVCKRVRAKSDLPIIMLTARDDDIDKIVGLEIGADDYLTKPFNPRELMARVKAILRRTKPDNTPAGAMRLGTLMVDPARHEASIAGQPIKLRIKEFELLATLMMNKGMVLTREKLLEKVWGYDFAGETRTVDVHVAQLRKRIAGSGVEIETVFGVGYKIVVSNE